MVITLNKYDQHHITASTISMSRSKENKSWRREGYNSRLDENGVDPTYSTSGLQNL